MLKVFNLHDSTEVGLIVIREAIDNSGETIGIIHGLLFLINQLKYMLGVERLLH